MTKLRRFLQSRGRLRECISLVKSEARLQEGENVLMPYEELFQINFQESKVTEFTVSRLCFLRIFYADSLRELGKHEHATEELAKALDLVRAFTDESLAEFSPRLDVLYSMVETSVNPISSPIDRIRSLRQLASRAAKLPERSIENALRHKALTEVRNVSDENKIGAEQVIAHKLEKELILELLSFASESGHLPSEIAACLMSLAGVSRHSESNAEWMGYFEQFKGAFPDFNMPTLQERLLSIAVKHSRNLNNDEAAAEYLRQYEQAVANCAGVIRAADGRLEASVDEGENKVATLANLKGVTIDKTLAHISTSMMIRWLRQEAQAGTTDAVEATRLLKIPSTDDAPPHADSLEHLDTEAVCRRIYGDAKPVEFSEWDSWLTLVERWLKRPGLPPSELERHQMLVRVLETRQLQIDFGREHKTRDQRSSVIREALLQVRNERERSLQASQSLDQRAFGEKQRQKWRQDMASDDLLLLMNLPPDERTDDNYNDAAFARIQEVKEQQVAYLREQESYNILFLALQNTARVIYWRWYHFRSVSLAPALKYIQEADEIFHRLAGQKFLLAAVEAIPVSMTTAESMDLSALYALAIMVSFEAWCRWLRDNNEWIQANPTAQAPSELDAIATDMVFWMQKSKARALALAMGSGSKAPEQLWRAMPISERTRGLMDKYNQLCEELAQSGSISRNVATSHELEQLWDDMEADVSAGAVLGMLRGRSTDSGVLRSVCSLFEEDVVFVDWIHIPSMGGPGDLATAVYVNGQLATILATGVKYAAVEAWVSENLDPDPEADEEEASVFVPLGDDDDGDCLSPMNGLLRGVEQFAKPGVLIVFCPTKALNRVPLHALSLGGEVCISRNPVVYCQSLTILRLCIFDRLILSTDEDEEDLLSGRRPAVLGPLKSRTIAAAALGRIATSLGTVVDTLDQMGSPKEAFVQHSAAASLIHFQGHVYFNESQPMEHHLELKEATQDSDGQRVPLSDDEKLTAKDILGMQFALGTHVTAISCKGARARVSDVNDHVGLTAAFHCANVPSVVSTLWNIHEDIGTRFSELFYGHLKQQDARHFKASDGNRFLPYVDMARAMQHAIVGLMTSTGGRALPPSHWASLVLNGNWALPHAWIQDLDATSS